MKKMIAMIAMMLCASPALAEDNLLSQLGLAGLEEVSVQEAEDVTGRGFVAAFGQVDSEAATASLDLDEGLSVSFQDLELQGLNAVEGLAGANSAINYSFSDNDGADIYQAQGMLMTMSSVIVGGSAK
jgi:hypothetical protein